MRIRLVTDRRTDFARTDEVADLRGADSAAYISAARLHARARLKSGKPKWRAVFLLAQSPKGKSNVYM
jgi:hypothetical protein